MSRRSSSHLPFALVLGLVACSSGSSSEPTQHPSLDAGSDVIASNDAGQDAGADASDASSPPDANADVGSDAVSDASASCDDKAKPCATQFGSLFTKANGLYTSRVYADPETDISRPTNAVE